MAEKIVNDGTRGMIRKINPLKKEQNFYNFALNLSTDKNRIDRITKVSESKLEDYFSLKNVDHVILNTLYLNLDEYVYFITDKIGSFSEIIYYNKGQITTKYNNSLLNFNPANVISSTYRVNYNGDRLIYFVDGFNKDRVFNLDRIELTDDIESISINPIYDQSAILNYTINYIGGTLPAGKYYIFIQPKDSNGKVSQYKNIIDGIPIENGDYKEELSKETLDTYPELEAFINETNTFNEVYGLIENTNTSKSVTINLENLNDSYEFIDIYVIIKNDTDNSVYLRENVIVSNFTTISSLENFVNLGSDISSILVNNIIYNNSETLVQKDNRLLLANSRLEGYNKDFQIIANNITVRPVLKEELFNSSVRYQNSYSLPDVGGFKANKSSPSLNSTSNEKNIFSTPYYLAKTQKVSLEAKTFMRDEVYALGIYFELDNGIFTDVYHIPGRKANDASVLTSHIGKVSEYGDTITNPLISTWDTRNITIDGETKPAWQLVNTAVSGLLGYYRCEEVYPDGYGFPIDGEQDINGKSYIRHHRIPSEYIYNTFNKKNIPTTDDFILSKNIINLEFDNIILPPDYSGVVKKVHFCIADRTENNKKVISKGIVYANRLFDDNVIRNSEVLNAPNSYDSGTKSSTIFEFKSPEVDFKFKNSNIKGSYIKPTNVLVGWVNPMVKPQQGSASISPESNNIFPVAGAVINYEGINRSTTDQTNIIYDYKQELTLNRVNYREPIKLDSFRQYQIDDMGFFDNNTITSFLGSNIKYEGNQNTSIFKLKNNHFPTQHNLFEPNDLNNYIPSLYKITDTGSSGLFVNFFFENQYNRNLNYPWQDRNVTQKFYYDSTQYVTILSNNTNIFSDILNLRYSKIVDNNRVIMGDSFIENHFTKKGYSTLVTENQYQAVQSAYNQIDKVFIVQNNPGGYFTKDTNIDISVSESYISFPVETSLNIRLRRNDGDNNHFPYNTITASYPVNQLEKKALSQEVYSLYNKYYNENSINPLFANNIKISDLNNQNKKIGNRIIYSELQNNESSTDNFRNFLANNYKDIITTKGNIHKLFIKDNNLFILTRDSLFRINSSNNYLTSRDGTEIYVGTGEFLGTEPEELISLETGFAGTSSKLSFNENKFGYLFVDSIRNKIMLFNDKLNDINILGLEEDLSINLFKSFPQLNDGLDKPLLDYGILSGFDPETDRLFVTKLDYKPTELMLSEFNNDLITINNGLFYKNSSILDFNNSDYFENKSFTVTYDGINNIWISYHNYFPKYYIPHSNLLLIKDSTNNIKKYGNDYTDLFIIDMLFNENQGVTKVFDSFQFEIQSESNTGEFTQNFFDKLIAYTDKQSTGLITLNPTYPNNNLTNKDTYWNFSKLLDISDDKLNKKLFLSDWNSIKDDYYIDKVVNTNDLNINKDWYNKKRLRDKYINLRLFKDNLENNKFSINFTILNYRQSIR